MVIYLEDSAERSDLWLVMLWFVSVVLIGGGLCMNLAPAVLKACFDTTAKDSIENDKQTTTESELENDIKTGTPIIHKTDSIGVASSISNPLLVANPTDQGAHALEAAIVESDTIVPKAKAGTVEGPRVHQGGVSEAREHELPPVLLRRLSTLSILGATIDEAEAAVADLNNIDPTEADAELNVAYEQELADVEMLSQSETGRGTGRGADQPDVCSENQPGSVTSCKCEGESKMKVKEESKAADGRISETTADRDGEATVSLHFPTALPHASNYRCVLWI